MGCWNATCGLTQLPIVCGTKIKLFILQLTQYKTLTTTCYSDDYFTPILPPLTGYYDDYGGIEEIEQDEAYALTQVWLEGKDLETYVKDLTSDDEGQSFMFMIDSIYNQVVESVHSTFKTNLEDYQQNYKALIEADTLNLRAPFLLSDFMITSGCASSPSWYYSSYSKLFKSIIAVSFGRDSYEQLKHWEDLIKIRKFMSQTRRLWMPQTGAGSQSEDLHRHSFLATITSEYINERAAQISQDEDDE